MTDAQAAEIAARTTESRRALARRLGLSESKVRGVEAELARRARELTTGARAPVDARANGDAP